MKNLTILLALIFTVMCSSTSFAGTTLSCKSTKTKDRAEIVIDRDTKTVVFFDMPANSQKKFKIELSILHDGEMRGGLAGDIGAFSNRPDFFHTITINKKNFNTTLAIHAREGRYSSQVELEEYECVVGTL